MGAVGAWKSSADPLAPQKVLEAYLVSLTWCRGIKRSFLLKINEFSRQLAFDR